MSPNISTSKSDAALITFGCSVNSGLELTNPDILTNFDEILRLSKIWVNIKFKNCKYHNSIMNKLNEMEKYTVSKDIR